MIKELSKEKGLAKARAICAKLEKCKADIRQKLYDWKVNPSHHNEIIESLEKEKFIDEKRYVEFFVRDKFKLNKWGKTKIEYALRSKLIDSELIAECINQIDDKTYFDTCEELINKKFKTLKVDNEQILKEKLLRFGLSRGFESSLVFKIVENQLSKK
ncbi:MAG: regulatory protein RecX [Bacteroidales bacterium]|nr:regulatory protein RecX [Bacteroidales bacterium]